MRRITFGLVNIIGCLLLVMLCSTLGFAQFRAGVQGVISDNAGGAVAGATVTLTNKETNQVQTMQSSDEGFYRFSIWRPGPIRSPLRRRISKRYLTRTSK
jgi:hypothetical protein